MVMNAQGGRNLRNVGGERVRDRLLQVVEDEPSFLDSCNDGCKVVIEEDHHRLLGDDQAHDSHGDTNVCLLGRGLHH